MDIKLKNSSKKVFIVLGIVILFCSIVMVSFYPFLKRSIDEAFSQEKIEEHALLNLVFGLNEGNYFLYNEYSKEMDAQEISNRYSSDRFADQRSYMDYEIYDEKEKPLLGVADEETNADLLLTRENTPYACRIEFRFSENGGLNNVQVDSSSLEKSVLVAIERSLLQSQNVAQAELDWVTLPKNVSIVYGISEEYLSLYIDENMNYYSDSGYALVDSPRYMGMFTVLLFVLGAVALIVSLSPRLSIGKLRVLHLPMEIALCTLGIMISAGGFMSDLVGYTVNGEMYSVVMLFSSIGTNFIVALFNVAAWFILFGIALWSMLCLGTVFAMKSSYFKERVLIVKAIRWMRRSGNFYGGKVKWGVGNVWRRVKEFFRQEYHKLQHFNIHEKATKTILRVIAINFVVLFIICSMWYVGFIALFIYSVLLFFFLRKFFSDTQKKYQLLLNVTSQLATGNLDVLISGDMGIFNPVQEELMKIQSGFRKAVQEEVKSERMKTELITNVSHDLKTPLTAIITYTDLLKTEKDEEKRQEYISVLEKKSLRLKVLIEDLFEISKATSKNTTVNFMEVDIVDLLKQVGLEYEEKMKQADLELRQTFPEHRISLLLDSQKTYRIFENLLVNITKYAMPHTRVYVEMKEADTQVIVSMKNISATELTFSTADITERFVRGDASRNTEGSGLGLAIAKSFTELQYGSLCIETEADLFKVVITFPKRVETQQEDIVTAEAECMPMQHTVPEA